MKFNSTALLVLLFSFLFAQLNAQSGFHLTKDINAQTDADPLNQAYTVDHLPYAVLNSVMYFSANDGVHGTELWRSDGTVSGTYMVEDLETGTTSSSPSQIIVSNNKLFFVTTNYITNQNKLWCSNGTAIGTTMLMEQYGALPNMLTDVSGEVYFFMFYYPQLWKTDGTVSGTVLVKDFGSSANYPYYPTAANGLLYFSMYTNESGRELWRSNGTDAGTFMVKDINPTDPFYSYNSGPTNLTAFHNKLYFLATDGNSYKLWYTNGTESGTFKVSHQDSIYPAFYGDFGYLNKPFTELNGNLILQAFRSSTGEEPYKYSPTNGFSLLRDITPGSAGNYIEDMVRVGKQVYFVYYDTSNKADEIWSTDGSPLNTFLVKSFDQGALYASHFTAGNKNLLYFIANSKNRDKELWRTNGMPGNAKMVKDIYEGPTSSKPECITRLNDKMYFSAASNIAGTELWQTDGSEANTFQVTEINTSSTSSSAPTENFYYNALKKFPGSMHGLAMGNTLYFSASKPKTWL